MRNWTGKLGTVAVAAGIALGAAACGGGSDAPASGGGTAASGYGGGAAAPGYGDGAAAAPGYGEGGAAAPGSGDGAAAPAAGAPTGRAAASVTLADSPLGRILTDRAGRTLYAFVDDKGGAASCTGECVATWPALAGVTPATAGPGVNEALLAAVPRAGGTTQTTYGGWPLYYYAGDRAPGDVAGQGVDGRWFAVGPAGTLVRATG